MKLIVSGKNLEVSEGLKEYVEKKIGRLDRYLPSLSEARVEFALEKTKSANQREVVQVTLRTNGTILRGEERASDFGSAVDIVLEKLERQIERYKGKHYRGRGQSERAATAVAQETAEADKPRIVRMKRFRTPPMTEEEAVEQMELLGHNFFV
ncbi:MAG: ribosome-associated translation inhibitor RaiA, partial [Chloroflexota bacterium]|nr:ribosome-associated translation inhibitor RaiA [Chloroflexota bacterium]